MMMRENSSYKEVLEKAFKKAETLVDNNDIDNELNRLKPEIAQWIRTIVRNLKDCKYLYSILITSLATKIVKPGQDIRKHQDRMQGGYSNRGTDQKFITPFLQTHGLTACAASGAESGRNFERPIPYTFDFPGFPRGEGNKEAFLHLIDAVQEKNQDPFIIITLLFALDMKSRKKVKYNYPEPKGLTIQNIIYAMVDHFRKAQGHNRSRLPVLGVYAVYLSLMNELARFKGMVLEPLEFHTTADMRSKKIGDIQVNRLDGTAFEGVEIKAEISFEERHIASLPEKFSGQAVDRYYLLTTSEEFIKKGHEHLIQQKLKEIRNETGCQIIVNGIIPTLKYYLRLLNDPEKVVKDYTELIAKDESVQDEHRRLWMEILTAQMEKNTKR
jgi:DNA (cytosine-5)-methyltransferase 1